MHSLCIFGLFSIFAISAYSQTTPPPPDPVVITTQAMSRFIETTGSSYISNTPKLSGRLARLSRAATRRSSRSLKYGSSARYADSLLSSGLELWTDGSYSVSQFASGEKESVVAYGHGGVDLNYSRRLIIGAIYQTDKRAWTLNDMSMMTTPPTPETVAKSSGWLAGPYVVARSPTGFIVETRASFGKSSTELMPLGDTYTDEITTERLSVSMSFGHDSIGYMGEWAVFPRSDYTYYSEEYAEYMNMNTAMGATAMTIPSSKSTIHRLTFGPTLSRVYRSRSGSVVSPSLSIVGLYDAFVTETENMPRTERLDLTGRIDFRLQFTGSGGLGWNMGGYYGGFGADTTSYGFTVGIGIEF